MADNVIFGIIYDGEAAKGVNQFLSIDGYRSRGNLKGCHEIGCHRDPKHHVSLRMLLELYYGEAVHIYRASSFTRNTPDACNNNTASKSNAFGRTTDIEIIATLNYMTSYYLVNGIDFGFAFSSMLIC